MLNLEISSYFRDLDWEKLKTFYYVAKVGNISHAAHFLSLTQSCSSRHITGLERHLGYPLFSRSQGGVTLTRKGQELFGIVEDVYLNVKSYTNRSNDHLQPGQKRRIRIASSHGLVSYLINDIILEYNKDYPEFLFEVIGVDQPIDVILHDVDIAIQPHDPKMDNINWQIIQEPFFTLESKLYASTNYLQKHGEPQTLEDLQNHHFLAQPNLEEDYTDDNPSNTNVGKNYKKRLNHAFLSNTLECLIEAALQDKGIISLYEKMTIVEKSKLKNILPDLAIKVRQEYLVYPEYLKSDQDIMHLKEYLKKRIR